MSRVPPGTVRTIRGRVRDYQRLSALLIGLFGMLGSAAGCADLLGPSGPPIYGVIVGMGAPVTKYVFPGMTVNMFVQANDSNHVVMQVDSWKWSSSNPSVADVDQAGHVTAKAAGIASITATARGKSGGMTLTVVDAQSLYAVDPIASNLLPGQKRSFRILEGPITGPFTISAHGKWTSSNAGVAQVDTNGVVTAIGPGKATLTVVRNVGVDVTLRAEVTVPPSPSPLRFLEVAAGDNFTCGRTATDTYCWGRSAVGTTASLDACSSTWYEVLPIAVTESFRTAFPCAMEPLRVEAPVPLTSISAKGANACGLAADGRAYCWGAAGAVPTLMSDSLRFASFIGQCGVTTSNEGWCGTPGALSRVPGGISWKRIDAGGADYHCGVELDGTYACWGANAKGQLGTGDFIASSIPVPIKSTERFISGISGSDYQSCALSVAGVVYCWGDWQLWASATTAQSSTIPTPIAAADPLASLSGDPWFGFCGLTSNGLSYCGNSYTSKMSVELQSMRFSAVAARGYSRCALAVDALLYCWGTNDYGQGGVGTQDYIGSPTRVVGQ
jgi:hypothetical protein